MPSVVKPAAADTVAKPRSPWVRGLGYGARIAVAAFVLWLGWAGINTFTALLRDDPPPQVIAQQAADSQAASFDWSQVVAAGGAWSFGDAGWSVSVRPVADAELPAALARPLADPAAFLPATDAERSILDILKEMPGGSTERDGGTEYVYESPAFQYVVRTRDVGGERRVCWARGAVRRGEHDWTLMETRPGDASPAVAARGALLPYPPDVVLLASRRNAADEPACEFIRTPGTLSALADFWRGRDVAATPIVVGEAGLEEMICAAGGRMFRVAALLESSATDTAGTTVMIAAIDPPTTPPSPSPSRPAP